MSDIGLRKNVLGFWQVLSVDVGLVVAPSTLMVVLFGFAEVGPAFLISMLIGAIIVGLYAVTISELSMAMPRAASFAEYGKQAFNPTVGIWQGFVFWSTFLGLAAEATIMGVILSLFFPAIPWGVWAVIIAAIFFVINLLGIKVAGWTELVVTIIFVAIFTVGSIIQMAGGGLQPFNYASFGGFAPAGWGPVMAWALMGVWAFVGISFPVALIEEVKNPLKTIPKSMFIALVIIFIVQAIVGLAGGGTLSKDAIFGAQPIPMIEAGKAFFGTFGVIIFAAAALAAGFGTFNAVMAGTSRVLWQLGSDGYLGKFIGYLHPKFRTPWTTLSLIFVIILILAFTIQDPRYIIAITAMMFCINYLSVHIFLIVLRNKKPDMPRPFNAGGPLKVPVVPVLGIISIIAVLYYQIFMDFSVLYVGGAVAVVFVILSVIIWKFYAKKKVGSG